eukprot:1259695-Amorphochlora_amoeboformis.AAC.1
MVVEAVESGVVAYAFSQFVNDCTSPIFSHFPISYPLTILCFLFFCCAHPERDIKVFIFTGMGGRYFRVGYRRLSVWPKGLHLCQRKKLEDFCNNVGFVLLWIRDTPMIMAWFTGRDCYSSERVWGSRGKARYSSRRTKRFRKR